MRNQDNDGGDSITDKSTMTLRADIDIRIEYQSLKVEVFISGLVQVFNFISKSLDNTPAAPFAWLLRERWNKIGCTRDIQIYLIKYAYCLVKTRFSRRPARQIFLAYFYCMLFLYSLGQCKRGSFIASRSRKEKGRDFLVVCVRVKIILSTTQNMRLASIVWSRMLKNTTAK